MHGETPLKYTHEELEQDIASYDNELKPIRKDRSERYGDPDGDCLKNVRKIDPDRSWRGAYAGAVECLSRLERMFKTDDCDIDAKDFDNACKDLNNFARYIPLLYRQKKLSSPCGCKETVIKEFELP